MLRSGLFLKNNDGTWNILNIFSPLYKP